MTIATLFLVLNPAVVAAVWIGYRKIPSERRESQTLGVVAVAAFALLALAVLVGETALEAVDISDATFLIATGVLVIFAAFQAFLRFGVGYALEDRTWLVVAAVMWLVSPASLAVAIAIRIEDGVVAGMTVAALAVAVALGLGYLWVLMFADRRGLILGWIRRGIAALAAIGGVDLIRQGVLSI